MHVPATAAPYEVRKAGGEQHPQVGSQGPDRVREIDTVELARHYDVGEQDIDPQFGVRQQHPMRVVSRCCLDHPVSFAFKDGERDLAHIAVVFNDKNGCGRRTH